MTRVSSTRSAIRGSKKSDRCRGFLGSLTSLLIQSETGSTANDEYEMAKHSSLRAVVKVEGVCGHCEEDISFSIATDRNYNFDIQIDTENFYLICPDCLSRRPDTLWPFMVVSKRFH